MSTPEQKAMQAKWIAALRSGEYKQAKGCLRDRDSGGYCCLGVAALLVKGQDEADEFFNGYGNLTDYGDSDYSDVQRAFGFRDPGGKFANGVTLDNMEIWSFAGANDVFGLTFEQIADLAEKNPDICFV